jgi:pre-mRNA-splicing factor SYF1
VRFVVYERAVRKLTGSYKLWRRYLGEREAACKYRPISDVAYEETNNCYERCLVHLSLMPRIWSDYLTFLMPQKRISATRHAFDRALRALPITQHVKWVWPLYIQFAKTCGVPETSMRVYRRFISIEPGEREEYIEFLKSVRQVGFKRDCTLNASAVRRFVSVVCIPIDSRFYSLHLYDRSVRRPSSSRTA